MRLSALPTHVAALLIGIILFGLVTVAFAWTGPQNTPPNCVSGQTGCDAPINVGTGSQVKNGNLSVNVFTATQNSLFYGSLGVGSSNAPSYTFDVAGNVRILNGSNPVAFTSAWSNFPGGGTNRAEISNDTSTYKTLMLVGNKSNDGSTRKVSVWDLLQVNGNVYANGYFHNSDERLKQDIQTSPGLDIVEKLRGVTFDWRKDGTPSAGVIAQEVEAVMPSAVKTDSSTGMKLVEYDQLIAPLIEGMKEQESKIDAQSAQIAALQENVQKLEATAR